MTRSRSDAGRETSRQRLSTARRKRGAVLWQVVRTTLLTCLLSVLPWPAVVTAQPSAPTIDASTPATLLVGVAESLAPADYSAWFQTRRLTLVRMWPELHLAQVQIPPQAQAAGVNALAAVQAVRSALAQEELVRFADIDHPVRRRGSATRYRKRRPRPTLPPEQWALARMNVPAAWQIAHGSPATVVAVIDSGVDIAHEDLPPAAIWSNPLETAGEAGVDDDGNGYVDDLHGWDWVDGDGTPQDDYGHGTHVAGIIAAATDNGVGVSGAGHGLAVMPLRVLDDLGEGRVSDVIDALTYAGRQGVRIVNLSLVIQEDTPALHDALRWAHDQDMLVVAAAGNMRGATLWPAAYAETVAVAATTEDDTLAAFTCLDAHVDLAAPGVNILSTNRDQTYTMLSGTSMAAAHVSALAGLLRSLRPDLAAPSIVALMQESAVPLAPSTDNPDAAPVAVGRSDFAAAVELAAGDLAVEFGIPDAVRMAPGVTVSVPVFVTAGPAATPVAGAVLHYRVHAADAGSAQDGSLSTTGTVVSNAQGMAFLRFVPRDTKTDYQLDVSIGATQFSTRADLVHSPAAIRLTRAPGVVTADDSSLPLRVSLLDRAGEPVAGMATVTLRGAVDDEAASRRALTVTTHDGVADVEFPLAHRRGLLAVTAQGAGVTVTQTVTVQAGLPVRAVVMEAPGEIETRDTLFPDQPVAATGTRVPLQIGFFDAHGNPVEDGLLAIAEADGASPTPQVVHTVDGAAAFLLIPTDRTKSAAVRVGLMNYDVNIDYRLPAARFVVHLPYIP
ncbi:MAG: S8 family peptidase [Caldilineaceae bacterium]